MSKQAACASCSPPLALGVEGFKAFAFCCFKQLRGGGDKENAGSVEHVAGGEGGGQLQSLGPAQRGAVEQLARGFEHGRIQRLLHHARGFKAQNFERRGGIFSG